MTADDAAASQLPAVASAEEQSPPSQQQSGRRDLRTVFLPEPKAAVDARKKDASRALVYAADRGDSQAIYALGVQHAANQPPIFAKPTWRRDMTPEELAAVEQLAYAQWTQAIAAAQQERRSHGDGGGEGPKINMYERNVEVWRQLWRVVDRCSVLVHLADARCPLLHLSDRLVEHILRNWPSKRVVIVLTKADLVDPRRVRAWVEYLEARYEHQIPVLAYSMDDTEQSNAALMRTIGAASASVPADERETPTREDEHDALVVGFVGEPNVGKSSLLNALFGRKLVSVSATPGHTKHLQTHFFERAELLERGDEFKRVVMCDCPGVVFPRLDVPVALQILFGSFPIAQTREPFSAVRFIAENCVPHLHEIYKLKPVDDEDDDGALRAWRGDGSAVLTYFVSESEWSPWTLCEAYAMQRGFHMKGGKFDVHRAANLILRDTLNGKKAVLSFPPPVVAA